MFCFFTLLLKKYCQIWKELRRKQRCLTSSRHLRTNDLLFPSMHFSKFLILVFSGQSFLRASKHRLRPPFWNPYWARTYYGTRHRQPMQKYNFGVLRLVFMISKTIFYGTTLHNFRMPHKWYVHTNSLLFFYCYCVVLKKLSASQTVVAGYLIRVQAAWASCALNNTFFSVMRVRHTTLDIETIYSCHAQAEVAANWSIYHN